MSWDARFTGGVDVTFDDLDQGFGSSKENMYFSESDQVLVFLAWAQGLVQPVPHVHFPGSDQPVFCRTDCTILLLSLWYAVLSPCSFVTFRKQPASVPLSGVLNQLLMKSHGTSFSDCIILRLRRGFVVES
ncbi:hypothetical protein Tco_0797562 [Tanacetum coccineum]